MTTKEVNTKTKDKAWLLNKNWQNATIYSTGKTSMYFAWGFAIFWNLISTPFLFMIAKEIVEKQNYLSLFALFFPLVGVALLIWAIRLTIAWRKFGQSPLTLDPFPASIGGNCGGYIDLNIPYSESNQFMITISNIYSRVTGAGKNRSRSERLIWQDKLVGYKEAGYSGTRVTFRFDIPSNIEEIKESDAVQKGNYYIWRLNLFAKLNGIDINRDFEIPVYKTAELSKNISNRMVELSKNITDEIETVAAKKLLNLTNDSYGSKIYFPFGRHIKTSIMGILAGAVFAGGGWFLIFKEQHHIFGGIFSLVGFLIIFLSIFMFAKSLTVRKNYIGEIVATRRLFGIPIKSKKVRIDDIVKMNKISNFSTGSGNKHTEYFKIIAEDKLGNEILLGEDFKGEGECTAAIKIISDIFAIKIK